MMQATGRHDDRLFYSANRVAMVLSAVALLVVLASLATQALRMATGYESLYEIIPLFYLDAEESIPTFFSTVLLMMSAGLLGMIGVLGRRRGNRDAWAWIGLSLIFVFLAADEAASIHEMLIRPIRELLGGFASGIFVFGWVIPYGLALIAFGIIYVRFWWRLPRPTRRGIALAGGLYLLGALGMEMVSGHHGDDHGIHNTAYMLMVTLEESLEMAGIIVLIHTLLRHLATQFGEVRLAGEVTTPPAPTPPTS